MMNLVMMMEMLCGEYGLAWADKWSDHQDDPKWLDKAMDNTFDRIREEDQELLRDQYEEWLWYAANLDLEQAVDLGFVAEVALLWGGGHGHVHRAALGLNVRCEPEVVFHITRVQGILLVQITFEFRKQHLR